jgi:hypothetical protein
MPNWLHDFIDWTLFLAAPWLAGLGFGVMAFIGWDIARRATTHADTKQNEGQP